MSCNLRAINNRQPDAILAFIVAEIAEKGYPPTVREICAYTCIKSTNGVRYRLMQLIKAGKLERVPHISRGIRVRPRNGDEPRG